MYNITSSEMEFKNYRKYSYMLAGRPLVIETGKMAGLANGSCLCRYGDTAVLCCATASEKPRDGIDFLPLSVDFDERMYAAGKIPGGYLKREGRPSEKAILTSRVIDRPIRPLFPKDLRNDIALSLIVMSVDLDCSPEITAMIGASVALSISDIPWNGPIAGVFMGLVDGELVVKGPLVCKGYHNNSGVTAQQITDGWLHTGDLGDISEDGFISITGRKKDLIITAGGKNVSPGLLEASVMTSPVVNQCLVIGDKKPFVAALVTLDLADANNWLESQGAKPEPDLASLAKNAIVHAEVERAVNAANEGVSRAESIRKFEILPDEFTEANGMLTPSLKTRRAQIVEHYRELIDDVIYVPLKK